MARHSKIEATYRAVIDSPTASQSDKLQAATMLDKAIERRTHRRNHTKAKAIVGIGARETRNAANSKIIAELPANMRGTDFSINTWPTWPKEKRDFWLSVWKLEQ